MMHTIVAHLHAVFDAGPYWLEPAVFAALWLLLLAGMFRLAWWMDASATRARRRRVVIRPLVNVAQRDQALTPLLSPAARTKLVEDIASQRHLSHAGTKFQSADAKRRACVSVEEKAALLQFSKVMDREAKSAFATVVAFEARR